MDNCSIHKGEEIEALIAKAGAKLIRPLAELSKIS
jgi:hypothetical protein